jgi:hypothetical protein
LAAFALLSGCGSSENASSPAATVVPSTAPPAGVQVTPTATADRYEPPPAASPPAVASPTPAATSAESQPGGAGDEEGPKVDARFTVTAGAVTPKAVSVPPFFPVDIVVVNPSQAPLRFAFRSAVALVDAGATHKLHVDGLKAGRYAVTLGEGEATLVVGNDAGP